MSVLHVWISDGETWACSAYDHGPFCRQCQRVDGITVGRWREGNPEQLSVILDVLGFNVREGWASATELAQNSLLLVVPLALRGANTLDEEDVRVLVLSQKEATDA